MAGIAPRIGADVGSCANMNMNMVTGLLQQSVDACTLSPRSYDYAAAAYRSVG